MKKQQDLIFSIILLIILVISVIFLYPKISYKYITFKRQNLFNEFISNTKTNQEIDLQKYWQLREFYCPGNSTFDRTSAYRNQIFLNYYCISFRSRDKLISRDEYQDYLDRIKSENKNIIFKNNKQIIYHPNKNQIEILFTVPAKEMKAVIGYFDYNEKDINLTKDKYWFNETTIINNFQG